MNNNHIYSSLCSCYFCETARIELIVCGIEKAYGPACAPDRPADVCKVIFYDFVNKKRYKPSSGASGAPAQRGR